MDVKEAVAVAKGYVADLFSDEEVAELGLEEVEFDDAGDAWRVTVGFTRGWQHLRASEAILPGTFDRPRNYKVVTIADSDRRILSLRDRMRLDG